jgi:uncharacterized iron-regulated membrane protein
MQSSKVVRIVWSAALVLAMGAPIAHATGSSKSKASAKASMQPKISAEAARATALARVPNGTVQKYELEREHGKLVYSFDIEVPGKSGIEELQVNAITGKVVSQKHETPAQEAKEARGEKAEKARKGS